MREDWKKHSTRRMGDANNVRRVMPGLAKLFNKCFCMPHGALVSFVYAERWRKRLMATICELLTQ